MTSSTSYDFNSIKVQLELPRAGFRVCHRGFQFHKGTIRTPPILPLEPLQLYFNSIKVRLERL